jgi:hypothetical protein
MTDAFELSDDDLRELFALFSSPTAEEIERIYSSEDRLFFRNEDVGKEYSLVQERGDYARDAWRAVMYFLHRHGYKVTKDGGAVDLSALAGLGLD